MGSTSTTDTENPFKYCGEYVDEETGFVYLRNRYYDPSIGFFTTIDPAMDGVNWYAYCGNNPTSYKDPHGLKFMFNNETDATTTLSIMETLTGYTGGYKLQDLGSGNYTIIDSGTGTINGGSATARGLIAAAMDMKASVDISYFADNGNGKGKELFNDSNVAPNGNTNNSRMIIEQLPNENLNLRFAHELTHAVSIGYSLDSHVVIWKYTDAFEVKKVIPKYYEAMAITIYNTVSAELGLDDVESFYTKYDKVDGEIVETTDPLYGAFPQDYSLGNATVIKTFGTDIAWTYQNYDKLKGCFN